MSNSSDNLAGSRPPRHSLAEIQVAIEALMSRLSGGKSYDASLAAQIAGNIHLAVNDPKSMLDNLVGNPAFERMVTEQAPKLNETVNDPAAKLAAARAEQARANVSGAPLSDATRAALGLARFADGRSASDARDGGMGGDRTARHSSETYKNALSSSEGAVFDSLAKTYGSEAAHSALDFANRLNATPDMARKFVKLDQGSRGELEGFVDGVRDDPSLTPEQKKAKVQEFRKKHPKIGKTLTDEDLLKIINRPNKKAAQHDINAARQTDERSANATTPGTAAQAEKRDGDLKTAQSQIIVKDAKQSQERAVASADDVFGEVKTEKPKAAETAATKPTQAATARKPAAPKPS
jgi:hypothetical protein